MLIVKRYFFRTHKANGVILQPILRMNSIRVTWIYKKVLFGHIFISHACVHSYSERERERERETIYQIYNLS